MRGSLYFAAFLAGVALIGSSAAYADSYTFVEGGYSNGGQVTGNFSGVLELDGTIQQSDLTAFTAQWSGNPDISAFSLGASDLFRFMYDSNTNALSFGGNMSNGIGIFVPSNSGATGRVGNTTIGNGPDSRTSQIPTVSPVPEPGSIALLAGMGLFGAGFLARRRKNARKTA